MQVNYTFVPRIPLDYIRGLVKNVREGNYSLSENLTLIGAISGELGALLKPSPTFALMGTESVDDLPTTLDGCIQSLSVLDSVESEMLASSNESMFDPTPYIPIILKLIELILSRRG